VIGVFPLQLLSEGDKGSLGFFLNGGVFVMAGTNILPLEFGGAAALKTHVAFALAHKGHTFILSLLF
jgi:hypothetical protein